MHAYLTRLGIRPDVQEFFAPFYHADQRGNLCFRYGNMTEIYGLAWHRIPTADDYWIAGEENDNTVSKLIICSSAMEAIAWLSCNFTFLQAKSALRFMASGNRIIERQLIGLKHRYPFRKYALLFANDLLGSVFDLKAAALLNGHAIDVSIMGEDVRAGFRNSLFHLKIEDLSLSSFERISAFRFGIKTFKPRQHVSWLSQLEAQHLTT